jgi:hypothetical protein
MLNAIIGDNAVGKTEYLRGLLAKYPGSEVVTNLRSVGVTDFPNFNEDRVYIMNTTVCAGLHVTGCQLASDGQGGYDNKTVEALAAMCRSGSIFIYDEPDRGMEERAVYLLYDALDKMSETFDDMWITTHFECIMDSEVVKLYTIDSGKLREVTEEEALEILDPF